MNEHPTPEGIMQLGLGFWGSKTLLSANELGVFTELAKGALEVEALIERLQLHPRSARDFFDALVALGMLERREGRYSNTPETDLFLDRAKPFYIGGKLEMANARLYRFWGSLTESLRTGKPHKPHKPQNEATEGGTLSSAPFRRIFIRKAMTGLSMGANMAIAQQFPWAQYQTFIDIGTAQGGLPVQVALAHDHLTGGGFDLPIVKPIFEEYIASFGLSERLHFYPGDFFEDPLPSADVISMGHILHDWDMEKKHQLIVKAYEALSEGGALIILESIIDDDRSQNAFGLLMSLNMLIMTHGGFDYTGADCCSWLHEAGFRETRVEHLVGPDSMVVGIK